jgi:hypothetical protein
MAFIQKENTLTPSEEEGKERKKRKEGREGGAGRGCRKQKGWVTRPWIYL